MNELVAVKELYLLPVFRPIPSRRQLAPLKIEYIWMSSRVQIREQQSCFQRSGKGDVSLATDSVRTFDQFLSALSLPHFSAPHF